MDLSGRGNNEPNNDLHDESLGGSSQNSAAANDTVDLEDAFPSELRSPKNRFVRPANDDEDYRKRSPDGRQRRELMKKALPGIALVDESESESLSQSYGNNNDNDENNGDDVAKEKCEHFNNSHVTLQTEPSRNDLLGNRNNNTSSSSSKFYAKICCTVLAFVVFTLLVFTAGTIVGVKTALSVEKQLEGETPTSPSDGDAKTTTTTNRFADLVSVAVEHGWAHQEDFQEGTPQYLAADWLAHKDAMQLVVDGSNRDSAELKHRFLLALFYYQLNGEQWHQQMGFLSDKPACSWNQQFETSGDDSGVAVVQVGVTCHDGAVRELYFPKNNLQGEFPSSVGFWEELIVLNLFDNKITGVLPESLSKLDNLQSLIVHNNQLEGPIPSWMGELGALRVLNLSDNRFAQDLPPTMDGLAATLEILALERNQLTGGLDALRGLHRLQAIYLGDNRLTGEFSDELLVSWTSLQVLDVSDNQLSGHLPHTLLAKQGLIVVDLHGNNFGGTLPNLIELEDSIKFLALHENELTGPVDERLMSLTQLEHLNLSSNLFTGEFPSFLWEMNHLQFLFLAFNERFKLGSIPSEFGRLTNLVDLSLQRSNRIGAIPSELGNLSNLVLLDLQHNILESTIPDALGDLSNLKFLLLKESDLQGDIPTTFSQLTQLDTLLLDGNNIQGGVDNVCDASNTMLTTFSADCSELLDNSNTGESPCECCTECCSDMDDSCASMVWYSDVDPVAVDNYARAHYLFHEDDIVFPVVQQEENDEQESTTFYDDYNGYAPANDNQAGAAFDYDEEWHYESPYPDEPSDEDEEEMGDEEEEEEFGEGMYDTGGIVVEEEP